MVILQQKHVVLWLLKEEKLPFFAFDFVNVLHKEHEWFPRKIGISIDTTNPVYRGERPPLLKYDVPLCTVVHKPTYSQTQTQSDLCR